MALVNRKCTDTINYPNVSGISLEEEPKFIRGGLLATYVTSSSLDSVSLFLCLLTTAQHFSI